MTRTEERLADALGAAARAHDESTFRPLVAPGLRRRPGWLAPVAAAASLLAVVGLGFGLSGQLPGSGGSGPPGPVLAPHRYYVEDSLSGGRPVVRSTATGAVMATVPVPRASGPTDDLVASTADGTYFVVANQRAQNQRIYRFELTGSGRITGFSAVPGLPLGNAAWAADAVAASPDGSQVAVALNYVGSQECPGRETTCTSTAADTYPDYIVVVDVATGARHIWRGGMGGRGTWFGIASLSWTGNGHELVFLAQSCGVEAMSNEGCLLLRTQPDPRTATVWSLNPASGGGRLNSGRVLLRQSAPAPYIAQALISPDGKTLTVAVLTGRTTGLIPPELTVEQISVATGKPAAVLYRRDLGSTDVTNATPDPVALYADGAGQHLLLNGGVSSNQDLGGFNGWINGGQLVPLPPLDGQLGSEAW